MFVLRAPTTHIDTSGLPGRDTVIAATQTRAVDIDTALTSKSNLPTLQHVHLQAQQTEFDWINNTNAFQRIKHLVTLKDNWDGYGAPKFARHQVERALELFSAIYSYFIDKDLSFSHFSPFIAPCSDGAILFQWVGKRFPDRDLEIYVPAHPDQPFEYLKNDQGTEAEGVLSAPKEVLPLLSWLFEITDS
jgi:hypothetical protein